MLRLSELRGRQLGHSGLSCLHHRKQLSPPASSLHVECSRTCRPLLGYLRQLSVCTYVCALYLYFVRLSFPGLGDFLLLPCTVVPRGVGRMTAVLRIPWNFHVSFGLVFGGRMQRCRIVGHAARDPKRQQQDGTWTRGRWSLYEGLCHLRRLPNPTP